MDIVEQPKLKHTINSDNKENRASKRPTTIPTNILRKKPVQIPIQVLDKYTAEEITIEIIESALSNEELHNDEDDEPIDPTYAMDYIADIMNLLYTLEKKYPIQSTFLINSSSTASSFPFTTMATMANGSATRPWKLTNKHRTIVVGWIIQLFYARFHLSQDALHMYKKTRISVVLLFKICYYLLVVSVYLIVFFNSVLIQPQLVLDLSHKKIYN